MKARHLKHRALAMHLHRLRRFAAFCEEWHFDEPLPEDDDPFSVCPSCGIGVISEDDDACWWCGEEI